MSERILQALMQLFAIGAAIERYTLQSRAIVEFFLRQQVSFQRVSEYLSLYDEFVKRFESSDDDLRIKKKLSVSSVKMLRICTEINKELNTRQKSIVFLRLAEFMQSSQLTLASSEIDFLQTVASVFTIEPAEHDICLAITKPVPDLSCCDSKDVLIVSSEEKSEPLHNAHQFLHEDLSGKIIFLLVKRAQVIFMRYTGTDQLTVNTQPVDPTKVSILSQGAVIRGPRILPLYYSNIIRNFYTVKNEELFSFSVNDLEFVFPNGKKGLHKLSFNIQSGTLAGIMGGSGAGKSTLLNILNGSNKATSGTIEINGIPLYGKENFQGMIGNIPQDDLLIEELTVFQNLYYNTKLCYGKLNDEEIRRKVINVLDSLGLTEIKDLKVGSVLNKTISGGQRKRLNIGLELVREPSILFVDEPTSGLSSRDAENVMDLLKQLSQNGKLVFVVIHQPSSDIFRMFDQLLMLDTGGYPVYFGNPSDAMIYFKRQAHLTDAEQSECPVCGNINPEQLFNILELHEVDEFGNNTANRRITPADWNELYKQTLKIISHTTKKNFTPPSFTKATAFRQWKIFFTRDFLARLSNRQYMFINLLEAPLLALLLGFILRYSTDSGYKFISNPNVPAYLFIGVIVALFLGLSVSAEEIIRDRKIQQREKFLHLSRTGYLLSKVCLLFIISAIQTICFVVIGNQIMGIHDMNLSYILILFSTSCFANLLGLNISAALDSAITVYILIPFLLIPQILLSGVIVRFEKLHPSISTEEGVPFIGNIMTSRWSYEALAVEQFCNNPFEKKFFSDDAIMSLATYKKDWWIPQVRSVTDKCVHLLNNGFSHDSISEPVQILSNSFQEEASLSGPVKFSFLNELDKNNFTKNTAEKIHSSLDMLREYYIDIYNTTSERKEKLILSMTNTAEKEKQFQAEKNKYENESLEEMVKNSNIRERLIVTDKKIVQRFEPVFHLNKKETFFAAPLFSSVKYFGGKSYSTMYANLAVIWLMTIFLYLLLYFDGLRKLISLFKKTGK